MINEDLLPTITELKASQESPVNIRFTNQTALDYSGGDELSASFNANSLDQLRVPQFQIHPLEWYLKSKGTDISAFYIDEDRNVRDVARELSFAGFSLKRALMIITSSIIPSTTGNVVARVENDLEQDLSFFPRGADNLRVGLTSTLGNPVGLELYTPVKGMRVPARANVVVASTRPLVWNIRENSAANIAAASVVGVELFRDLVEAGIEPREVFGAYNQKAPFILELTMMNTIIKYYEKHHKRQGETVRIPNNIVKRDALEFLQNHPTYQKDTDLELRQRKIIDRWAKNDIVKYDGDGSDEFQYHINPKMRRHVEFVRKYSQIVKGGNAEVIEVLPGSRDSLYIYKAIELLREEKGDELGIEEISELANALRNKALVVDVGEELTERYVAEFIGDLHRFKATPEKLPGGKRKFNKRLIPAVLGKDISSKPFDEDGNPTYISHLFIEAMELESKKKTLTQKDIHELLERIYPLYPHPKVIKEDFEEYKAKFPNRLRYFTQVADITGQTGYFELGVDQERVLRKAMEVYKKALKRYEYLTADEEGRTSFTESFIRYEMDEFRIGLVKFLIEQMRVRRDEEEEDNFE